MRDKIIGILILLIIMVILAFSSFFILINLFYQFEPHSPSQNAIGEITGLTCDSTHIVYYRYSPGFLGITTTVETIEDKADFSVEECLG